MSLQWFPGHMTKARRELAALMPSQDVVIEVLDARLPASSANPLVTELRLGKPCIKVLTKSDLADPAVTKTWIDALRGEKITAFASSAERAADTRKQLAAACVQLGRPYGPEKVVRALIAGVPNVGKSSLINVLMERKVSDVSDKPAVTKLQKRVLSKGGLMLTDTPGIMWPKIEDEARAFRLALAGSIPETAFDYLTIGLFAAGFLLERYASLVTTRYKLAALPRTAEELLHAIGRARGQISKGGGVDLHKASEHLVHDFRTGTLGRISLETPS